MKSKEYTFIVWPEFITLKLWADTLCGTYSQEFLPVLKEEKDFLEWAAIVAGTGIFAQKGVPSPLSISSGKKQGSFSSWQEWAKKVYSIFINETEIKENVIG